MGRAEERTYLYPFSLNCTSPLLHVPLIHASYAITVTALDDLNLCIAYIFCVVIQWQWVSKCVCVCLCVEEIS